MPTVGPGLLRYPFFYRRQLAGRYHGRQHRRLAELGDLVAGVGLVLLQGVPLPYVALLGHHFGRWRGHLYVAFTLSAGERGSRRQTCDQGSQYEPPCLSRLLPP